MHYLPQEKNSFRKGNEMSVRDLKTQLEDLERDFDDALRYLTDFAERQNDYNKQVTKVMGEFKDALLEMAKDVDKLNKESEDRWRIPVHTPIGGNGGVH